MVGSIIVGVPGVRRALADLEEVVGARDVVLVGGGATARVLAGLAHGDGAALAGLSEEVDIATGEGLAVARADDGDGEAVAVTS